MSPQPKSSRTPRTTRTPAVATGAVPTVTLSTTEGQSASVDVLVVGMTPRTAGRGDGVRVSAPAAGWTPGQRGRLERMLAALGATAKPGDIAKAPGEGLSAAPLIIAVGLPESPDAEDLRRAAGVAARAAGSAARLAVALPARTDDQLEAVALGTILGAYRYTAFRSGAAADAPRLRSVVIPGRTGRSATAKAAVDRARIVGEAVCTARDLVNTPPSALPPATLAKAAQETCRRAGLRVEVLDERALERGGYGGILGVGKGSVNPPRLVRIEYRHPRATTHLAFVGKGITFDSGGLSLKPPQAMETMKCDMSGAAAVITALAAIARLKLRVNVTGWAACAENMPSGTAQRPSDVLTTYGGKTVEVMNTDAEGRLVLADALVRAQEEGPDLIVDLATLTGAAPIALGRRTSGVMGSSDRARDRVWEASRRAGETMWHMPIPEELRASIDSPVADIKNTGERFGGMMTGAVFLREFIEDGQDWVHVDIAGPAFNEGSPYGYTPAGGTGVAVRTLVQLAVEASA